MGIGWSSKLSVGVELIDEQHKELFSRVSALITAMESQKGQGEVQRLVEFLGTYVLSHFQAEERLMSQYAYPDAAAHKREHADLVKDLGNIKGELTKAGASALLAVQLNNKLCSWLIDHIGRTDRALGAFLSKKLARPAASP